MEGPLSEAEEFIALMKIIIINLEIPLNYKMDSNNNQGHTPNALAQQAGQH